MPACRGGVARRPRGGAGGGGERRLPGHAAVAFLGPIGHAPPALRALPRHRSHARSSVGARPGVKPRPGCGYHWRMGALPSLRRSLDLLPSPDETHPGLLIRDPLGYSEGMLVCPPPLVPFLRFFDGEHGADALEAALRSGGAGEQAQPLASHLATSLARAGFLEDEGFALRREEKHAAFARSARREPAHAGGAYPADPVELRDLCGSASGSRLPGPSRTRPLAEARTEAGASWASPPPTRARREPGTRTARPTAGSPASAGTARWSCSGPPTTARPIASA